MFKLMSRFTLPIYRRSFFPDRERLYVLNSSRNFCFQSSSINICKNVNRENTIFSHTHFTKISFHTSSSRNALPPLVLILMRPLTRFVAVVFGRTIRVWWGRLPQERRNRILQAFKKRKLLILALLTPFPLGATYYYATHVEETPITKRKRFVAFSDEQMIRLANIEQEVIFAEFKNSVLNAAHPLYCRVSRVVYRILDCNKDVEGIHSYPWRIVVVDAPEVANAFVLPNGTIFIFTGMLDLCANDNQLSIVLAHEMSHTILRHTAERMSNAQFVEFMLFIPIVLIWAVLPDVGALLAQWFSGVVAKMLLHLPFSRQTEMEADDVGLTLAAKACFDVREATCFWKKMKAVYAEEDDIEWLSTHPSYDTRLIFLDELIPSALELRDSCQCPRLSKYDPRMSLESFKRTFGKRIGVQEQLVKA